MIVTTPMDMFRASRPYLYAYVLFSGFYYSIQERQLSSMYVSSITVTYVHIGCFMSFPQEPVAGLLYLYVR